MPKYVTRQERIQTRLFLDIGPFVGILLEQAAETITDGGQFQPKLELVIPSTSLLLLMRH